MSIVDSESRMGSLMGVNGGDNLLGNNDGIDRDSVWTLEEASDGYIASNYFLSIGGVESFDREVDCSVVASEHILMLWEVGILIQEFNLLRWCLMSEDESVSGGEDL